MRIVDLTMTLTRDTITYPGHPIVEINKIRSFEEDGKEVRKIVMGTHTGTHIDAPRHYIEGGATVESLALEKMCGPAQLMNLAGWNGPLHWRHLERLAQPGLVDRVLIRFDGDKLLGSMDYYTKQPWITEDAARWLVDNGCTLLGMDTPMPDAYENCDTMPVHKILLGAGVILAEYLVNLAAIKAETFQLIVAPLKIKDGDGAPARCFAIVDD
jgi:arylformamidase